MVLLGGISALSSLLHWGFGGAYGLAALWRSQNTVFVNLRSTSFVF